MSAIPSIVPLERAALAALAAATLALPAVASAQPVNQISGVAARESGSVTEITIRGTRTPTFTVYKLDRPSRVVVDITGARLRSTSDERSTWNVNTWAVSDVSAHPVNGGARVVVRMARSGKYKVTARGNNVLVRVTPREARPAAPGAASAEAARAAAARADAARRQAEKVEARAAERERAAERRLARADARLAEAQQREAEAARQAAAAAAAEKAAAERDAAARRARSEAERLQEQSVQAQKKAEEARAEAAAARRARSSDAAKKAAAAERAVAAAARRRQAALTAAQAAERRQAEAEAAASAADKRRLVAGRAVREADDKRAAAEQARAAAQAAAKKARERARAADQARAAAIAEADQAEARARAADEARAAAEDERAAAEKRAELAQARAESAEQAAAAAVRRQQESERAAAEAARRLQKSEQAAAAAAQRQKLSEQAAAEAVRRRRQSEQAALEAVRRTQQSEQAAAEAARRRQVEEEALAAARSERRRVETQTDAAARRLAGAKQGIEAASTRYQQAVAAEERARARVRASVDGPAGKRARQELARLARKREQSERDLAAQKRQAATLAAERERLQNQVDQLSRKLAVSAREVEARKAEARKAEARLAKAREVEAREVEARAAEVRAAEARLAAARKAEARLAAARKAEQSRKVAEASKAAANHRAAERKSAEARKAEVRKAEARLAAARAAEARLAAARKAEAARKAAEARKVAAAQLAEARKVAEARKAADARRTETREAVPSPEVARANQVPLSRRKSRADKGDERRARSARPAVKAISYEHGDERGNVVIAVDGEARPRVISARGRKAILQFEGVSIARKLERTLDARRFGGPVKKVSSFRDPRNPETVRIVVELERPTRNTIERRGDAFHWSFHADAPRVSAQPAPNRRARPRSRPPVRSAVGLGASTPITNQTVAQSSRRRKVYRGRKIDLDFKDADIHNLLRLLADVGGVNIIIPDEIRATVTVRLRNVPWDQAMEVILASKGLWYRREGTLIRIAPRKVLDAEDKAEAERLKSMAQTEAPEPEIFTLNYAGANQLRTQLTPLLSPKGRIEVDPRTNSLIVNDIRANRRRIIDLVTRLDTQTPQVQIEARIVDATSNFNRQLGIQWGGNFTASAATGNATGLVFPNSVRVGGAADDGQTATAGLGDNIGQPDFAVNLPAAIGSGSGGGLGFTFGSVGGNFNLALRLSALEDRGSVRIISSPKITTINNVEATISSGVSIPISVISANGVQTQFVNADLSLKVTPSVSQRDCSVSLAINLTNNQADFANTGARGDPSITRSEATTTLLVGDGDTVVVGGVYTRNTAYQVSKVPFFGDLPIVGILFRSRSETDDRSETLIFITPKITNRAFLRCDQ